MTIEIQPRLGAGSEELRSQGDLTEARRCLKGYAPADAEQERLRHQILDWIQDHPDDAHRRSCLEGHLTASALVVDEALENVILLHHRKLGRWLQPGGHCDGDANLVGVAWREANEETGIEELEIVPRVFDLDIHRIPEFSPGSGKPPIPSHLHLDTRFLILAPRSIAPRGNDESRSVRWFSLAEARGISDDGSVQRMLSRLEAHHGIKAKEGAFENGP